MITKNRNAIPPSASLAIILATLLVVAPPVISSAEAWELRTVDKEVPGTREIESGDVEKSIQISKVYLTRIPAPQKVAVLTNLCIGYILLKDFAQAREFCDRATERKVERPVTFNNRGVLNALTGDDIAARRDFAIAAGVDCDPACDKTRKAGRDYPRHVAQRNLEASAARILAAEQATGADQYTAREHR